MNIAELYKRGLSVSEIVKITAIPKHTIIKTLNNCGINLSRRLSINDDLIKNEYLENNLNVCEIARKYNLTRSGVYYRVCKMGINKSQSEIMRDNRIVHNYFNVPTVNNSYWAGFLAADGSVVKTQVRFLLQKNDLKSIKNFATEINFNNKLTLDRNSVGVCFGSEEMCRDLCNNFNITTNKSLTLNPPLLFEKDLVRSFILGYLDGDGYICKTFQKIGFAGTKNVLSWVKENVCKNCAASHKNKITEKGNIYELCWGGKQVSGILKWLYTGSTPKTRLERKYKIANEKYGVI